MRFILGLTLAAVILVLHVLPTQSRDVLSKQLKEYLEAQNSAAASDSLNEEILAQILSVAERDGQKDDDDKDDGETVDEHINKVNEGLDNLEEGDIVIDKPPHQLLDDEEAGMNAHDMILAVNSRGVGDEKDEETADERINQVNKDLDNLEEGDIVIDKPPPGLDLDVDKRSTLTSKKQLWSLPIPYVLDDSLSNAAKKAINAAMEMLKEKTCISFREQNKGDSNWLNFMVGGGCYSSLGVTWWRHGGQNVSIGNGCQYVGIVTHEIMHALGFYHEQSRPDRDDHVEIFWENIKKGRERNFVKAEKSDAQNLQYDLDSIMHYSKRAFSKNGNLTIVSLQNPDHRLGQRNGPSKLDLTGIDKLYCQGKPGVTTEWSPWSDCDSKCIKTRQRFLDGKLDTDAATCAKSKCNPKVNGHWGKWSDWGMCSVTCGSGKRQRTRKCDNPAPKHGGEDCQGASSQPESCDHGPCGHHHGIYDMDFEHGVGFGVWKSVGERPFTRATGKTPTPATGPESDHTVGNSKGHYVYFETSLPVKSGQQAILQATIFAVSRDCKMEFYYHMYGQYMGSLQVNVTNGSHTTVPFKKSGDQGNKWKKATIHINGSTSTVKFVATKGAYYRSDIALDDISFIGCTAKPTVKPPMPTTATPTVKPTMPTTATARPVIGQFGKWSAWTSCSNTCGGGVKTRTRQCMPPTGTCVGITKDTRKCLSYNVQVEIVGEDWITIKKC